MSCPETLLHSPPPLPPGSRRAYGSYFKFGWYPRSDHQASLNIRGASSQFLQMSPDAIAAAPSMDPSLEALLRSVNLCTAFRVQEITDRELFVALDTSEESLRDTCKEAFGVDSAKGFAHKKELGKIIKAWNNAKVHSETKLKIDAVARSHGQPVSMLCADWEALMTTFETKFGAHIHDTLLPSQSCFGEQDDQESEKPDTQRHMSLHHDG